jgi:hypothetical protein
MAFSDTATISPPSTSRALEPHFSIQEIAESWNLSPSAVREIFRSEPGVVRMGRPRSRFRRSYTTLRVPRSVLERVHARMKSGPIDAHGRRGSQTS